VNLYVMDAHAMIPLFAVGIAAALPVATLALADGPAFDCAKAQSDAEQAVCASESLAAMDRELARLYGAALNGPNLTEARATELKAFQSGWIKGRDECWKSSRGVPACGAGAYALRSHEIRD